MGQFELLSFANDRELAQAAARAWLDEIESARRENRSHHVALSGGRIAKTFCSAVVENARGRDLSLDHVHFFWADERCVSPTDAESNFAAANQLLFQPLALRSSHIHRIRGEDDPESAASLADDELRGLVPHDDATQPILDLVLLGMGEDGHIASLFPGSQTTTLDARAIYFPVVASKPPPRRITISYATLRAAREVWVLASGAGKETALQDSLTLGGKTPLATLVQLRKSTRILTDICFLPPLC